MKRRAKIAHCCFTAVILTTWHTGARGEVAGPTGNNAPAFNPPAPTEKSFIYSPVGKRDPFKAAVGGGREIASLSPLEKFSIEQFQLRAILRGDGKVRAMFEDPEGATHIIAEGDLLGRERGKVSRILDQGVIVTEKTFNYLGVESLYEKVISLPEK